jgi:hypothetical protein
MTFANQPTLSQKSESETMALVSPQEIGGSSIDISRDRGKA